MPLVDDPNVLVDAAKRDDAAVYRIADDRAVVATVDFFAPIVDDAYAFGAIAAANAFSDIYAMGAKPLFALNLALSEPPQYTAAQTDPELNRAFMVILGLERFGQFDEIVKPPVSPGPGYRSAWFSYIIRSVSRPMGSKFSPARLANGKRENPLGSPS